MAAGLLLAFRSITRLRSPSDWPISFNFKCHKESKLRLCSSRSDLGVISLAEVRLQEGESVENALRRFKRKVQTEDIIKEVKRHSFYLKPGAKRRVKQALARKRARKKLRKDSDNLR